MRSTAGLIQVEPDDRAIRFAERRRHWRSRPQRIYARHAEIEPHAALLLAAMFDRAVRIVSPCREYGLTGFGLPTVRLNADSDTAKPWSWHTTCGTAGGRGLYELWAWRFDIPVDLAADEIWATIHKEAGA